MFLMPAPTVERNTVPLSGSGWMLNVTPKNAFTTRSVCTARGVSCPSRTLRPGRHCSPRHRTLKLKKQGFKCVSMKGRAISGRRYRTRLMCSGPMAMSSSTSGWCELSTTPPRCTSATAQGRPDIARHVIIIQSILNFDTRMK